MPREVDMQVTVLDSARAAVPGADSTFRVRIEAGGTNEVAKPLVIARPRFWNGRAEPNLYTVRVELRPVARERGSGGALGRGRAAAWAQVLHRGPRQGIHPQREVRGPLRVQQAPGLAGPGVGDLGRRGGRGLRDHDGLGRDGGPRVALPAVRLVVRALRPGGRRGLGRDTVLGTGPGDPGIP